MKEEKNIKPKKSTFKFLIIFILAILIVFCVAKYITDDDFRYKIDTNLLKKQVSESNLKNIEIDSDDNPSVFAYDKYITVLSKNTLTEYTSDGNSVAKLDVSISVPLVETNGKYMVMAEKGGQKIYLISGTSILWQNNIEGSITRVNVNRNGYVSVIIQSTIYKSVIIFYDLNGKELFRSYLSTNYAICTAVSTNNKYLAIGEIDYSGTIIKSYVKVISVDLAQTDAENSTVYTYEAENGEIVTDINYQDKENAICMFDSYVQKVGLDSNERLYEITDEDVFVDINLKDGYTVINKQSSGLFQYEYEMKIKDTNSKSESLYILNNDLPKSMSTSDNKMALNLGNEVQIVDTNGWLLKKYTSTKQIDKIVLGDSIAGVVYKNKIEIIDL
ncbi:MAG TPA: hypothetical protein IAD08_05935 [Candidatus Scatovivens faecipullorum]|nr:hypothetical protein [Candidatus Scatovivens faecipullorum]